jgi:dTDP-4-amino-4,6-dideoxygalactose transaminase
MSKIEFGEIRVNDDSKKHIQQCLDQNWLTAGDKTVLFERYFPRLFSHKYYCATVNSGTAADTAACLALYDLGAKRGMEIICPALTFCATWEAILFAGFTPKPIDIDISTLQIDTTKLEEAISSNTAGIMAVNLMGRLCDLDKIQNLAKKYNLPVIIDNCESYGATLDDAYSLEYGDFETTSHYTAHLCPSVELGTVMTKTEELRDIILSIRSHGRKPNQDFFDHDRLGFNFKPTDLHCSIGLGNIPNFWINFSKRRRNLKTLNQKVKPFLDKIWVVEEDERRVNAPHAFSITLKPEYQYGINVLQDALTNANIKWKKNFGAITQHKAFDFLNLPSYPQAEQSIYGLHIGVHEYLSEGDIEYIGNTIESALEKI